MPLASIPSPSVNVWEIGPFSLHLYGLCIALGVVAAVTISSRRWQARGGHADDITTIALWAVPAGVVGARLYHVVTDWKKYQDDWAGALNITQGGLGIPGGIALGVIVGLIVVRRNGWPTRDLLDVVAPAIPVAQAIGRLGNWFNQEVFGRPSDLPWALEIDADHRPVGLEHHATFHPTFLYEGLWNLALAGFLVWLDRRKVLRRGELFLVYVFGYSIGRLWVESIRSDEASLILGIRVNIWMSVIVAVVTAGVFAWNRRKPAPEVDLAVSGQGSAGAGTVADDEVDADGANGERDTLDVEVDDHVPDEDEGQRDGDGRDGVDESALTDRDGSDG